MPLNHFITYFSILFFATIIPGPSMLLAINHGANHGISKAIYSCLGNVIGNLLMAFLSFLGLGVILLTSGVIFNIIKWAGIAYLMYIGIKLLTAPVENTNSEDSIEKTSKDKKGMKLFFDGFVIAVGNPKGIMFFTALFPQFINMQNVTINLFMVAFGTLGIIAFSCYMLYAVFGVKLNKLFRLKSFRKIFNRISGSLFIGLGLTLAFAKK